MRRQIRIEHVISFGDAIFAFSITFMAISIQIPNLPENLTQTQLLERLMELRSHFEIYALSFFIVGIYWIAYHQILEHLARTHGTMIWLNLCFLFFIYLNFLRS
ncbi:MAG: TMEM175 family protein [Nitrososphaeraceae archaeon]